MVNERSYQEWQALKAHFKSRISAMKVLMESEYGKVADKKTDSEKVREADSNGSSKS